MKAVFCPFSKTSDYSYEVLSELSSTDIKWLQEIDSKKTSHLQALLSEKEIDCKVIKISKDSDTLLFYLLEIIPINLKDVYKQKEGLLGKISSHLLSFCNFKIAHPCHSILYDFDFCVYDAQKVDSDFKTILVAQSLDIVSSKLGLNIVTLPCKNQQTHTKNLQNMDFEEPLQDFTMEIKLEPEWSTFKDYQNNLKRKYAKRAQNIRSKGEKLTYKNLDLEAIKLNNNTLYSLYLQVIQSQKFMVSTATKNHFITLKEIYNDQFQLEGIYSNENLVGFISYFIFEQELFIHYIGIDYSANEEFDIYFNILFRTIELGFKENKRTINYGRTSLDAKASLGATPKPQKTYVKTYGLTKIIKKQVIKQIESLESHAWKQRKPFKNDIGVLEEA